MFEIETLRDHFLNWRIQGNSLIEARRWSFFEFRACGWQAENDSLARSGTLTDFSHGRYT